jgi:eukaryotic-like serine/threonine-protein kinase
MPPVAYPALPLSIAGPHDQRRAQFGDASSTTAIGANNLAVVVRDRGDLDRAEALLRGALNVLITVHGADHSNVAAVHFQLGSLLATRGEDAGAEAHLAEALRIRLPTLGEEHADIRTNRRILDEVRHRLRMRSAARDGRS